MPSSPRIAVIVTCCNLGRFLPETLASVTAQTFRDFEICIVDDGSSEPETVALLDSLSADMHVVRTGNRGLSAARNTGLAHTRAELVCAVDADDVLMPALFERSVARLDASPGTAFVSHWLETFGDETWDWRPERCDFPTLLSMNTVNGSALVRRHALEAIGGWDEEMRDGCEDWDLWISLVERGFTGDIIPEILFRYRRRADSMSRVKFSSERFSRTFHHIVEKHHQSYRQHLAWLAARQERDTVGNRARADIAEERLILEYEPALSRAVDDLAAVEREQSRLELERQRSRELAEIAASRDRLWDETQRLQQQVALSDERAKHLDAARLAATYDVSALHQSWSWRLTAPMRVVGSWILRLTRRHP